MTDLDQVPVSEIRVVDMASKAPKRTLLQLSVQEKEVIGMRCNFKIDGETLECILIVSGEHVGQLLTRDRLLQPALDVSELLELTANSPGIRIHVNEFKPGMLLRYRGGYYVWFRLSGRTTGLVCIADDANPDRVGEVFDSSVLVDLHHVVLIARTIGVRTRSRPIRVTSDES